MYQPVRRNRNIGTSKQGHGQDNKMVIPYPAAVSKDFFECLAGYKRISRDINGQEFIFVTENTRAGSAHACSVDDVAYILGNIPLDDLAGLRLIIFRQPKRKEETLSTAWGRLVYSYEFENDYQPAIIIEAIDYRRKFRLSKSLSVEGQKELERLLADGHLITDTGRWHEADYQVDFVRNTQLYRTLLHEIGHYVHYLDVVQRPGAEDEDFEEWERRNDRYFSFPAIEKEQFAHRYAGQKANELRLKNIIPFKLR